MARSRQSSPVPSLGKWLHLCGLLSAARCTPVSCRLKAPNGGHEVNGGEYPALALRSGEVDTCGTIDIARLRTFDHAVFSPRLRLCLPTSSDLAPYFRWPQSVKRSGALNTVKKSLKINQSGAFAHYLNESGVPRGPPPLIRASAGGAERGIREFFRCAHRTPHKHEVHSYKVGVSVRTRA